MKATPEIVPFDDHGNTIAALKAGKAVGPVQDQDEWAVELITEDARFTFLTEDAARAYWHEHGGQLVLTRTTSWTLASDWQDRGAKSDG